MKETIEKQVINTAKNAARIANMAISGDKTPAEIVARQERAGRK